MMGTSLLSMPWAFQQVVWHTNDFNVYCIRTENWSLINIDGVQRLHLSGKSV